MYFVPQQRQNLPVKSIVRFILKNTLITSLITSIPIGFLMVYVNKYILSIFMFIYCMYLYIPVGLVVVTTHIVLTTFCVKLIGDTNRKQLTIICGIIGMLLLIGVYLYRPFVQPHMGAELVVVSMYIGGLIIPAMIQIGSVIWHIWHDPDPWDLLGVLHQPTV
ncbi:hypothetical protein Hgul01_03344 [Herpetosiphon gulosus]|uniref:Uncharacterized protein n=2 Tax=Herpetosiphon gulosus TaxID=1973496 RepID=A0ABP9X2G2_9CHLR